MPNRPMGFTFTGSALTLMTIGLFCATENLIAKLQRKVFIDEGTGTSEADSAWLK